MPICVAERQVFGFDHAEVGGALAEEWKLPPMLQRCIACHHDLDRAANYPREAALTQLANQLALLA